MKVEVQLVNEKGRLIRPKERHAMPRYQGMLRINESRHQSLGRICVTAALLSRTDAAELPLLPPLMDAVVLFSLGARMRIRGFEVMDEIQYGQTWDVKVS